MPRARGFVVDLRSSPRSSEPLEPPPPTTHGSSPTTATMPRRPQRRTSRGTAQPPSLSEPAYEGYQWAGGCWNDNDRDDSPNDPHEDPATGGEGGDCSGFTFKVWREPLDQSRCGIRAVGALAQRPWAIHRRRVQGWYGSAQRDGVQDGADQDGRPGERHHIGSIYAVNPDGTRPDHRGEGRGLRHGNLDPNVPGELELQRRQEDRLELLT